MASFRSGCVQEHCAVGPPLGTCYPDTRMSLRTGPPVFIPPCLACWAGSLAGSSTTGSKLSGLCAGRTAGQRQHRRCRAGHHLAAATQRPVRRSSVVNTICVRSRTATRWAGLTRLSGTTRFARVAGNVGVVDCGPWIEDPRCHYPDRFSASVPHPEPRLSTVGLQGGNLERPSSSWAPSWPCCSQPPASRSPSRAATRRETPTATRCASYM